MNCVDIDVIAMFEMLPTSVSGWKTPVMNKLRPNHNFNGPENTLMCFGEVVMVDEENISPGESKEVMIQFISLLPEFASKIKVGFKWRIQAGSQHFANGEIIDIV